LPLAEPEPPLVAELARRGVTKATAADMVQQYPAELIERKIEVFDWLAEKQDKRIAKSPEGYLCESIRKDYATPKGFVSRAERQRREEERQAKEREAAEARRRKQVEEARQQAEKKAILDHWASLTPKQQAKLQADADAQADPVELAKETGPFKSFGQTIRRHAYIRQLLQAEGKLPPAEG
jgi:hypothetical protein